MGVKKKIGLILEKAGLKQTGIRIDLTVNRWKREAVRKIRYFYIPIIVKRRAKSGVLAIDLDSDWLGLGARIVATIELLMYAEEKGLMLKMKYSYRIPKDRRNYFQELFDEIGPEGNKLDFSENLVFTSIRSNHELQLEKDYNKLLDTGIANRLFSRHYRFKTNIAEQVNQFADGHFKGSRILGLHYRGTDKIGEAPKVSLDFVARVIAETLANSKFKYDKLFISSDESSCIDYFKSIDTSLQVIWRDDIYRSRDGNQFHRNPVNDFSIINQEALINCLLLSKCDLLIKTASILSDCSKIFNPDLEMIILNEPHSESLKWWPATELNKKYLYRENEQKVKEYSGS